VAAPALLNAMRVLYVEDSESLRRSVGRALRHAGFAVDVAADGEEGLAAAELNDYDALVLDVMLPKLDGLTVLRRVRAAGRTTHVLLLTARDTVADRVEGLRLGADDYLVKPFALAELLARVEALCRRAYGTKTGVLQLGPMEVDLPARRLRRGRDEIPLTAREWRLLEYLMMRRGQVVPRTEIEAHIYDDLVEPMSNVVDSAVYGLRRKIGPDWIQTRRGLGYVLEAE
jgi:DNA-binding response OmpR family regulator